MASGSKWDKYLDEDDVEEDAIQDDEQGSRWQKFLKEDDVQDLALLHKITCCTEVPCKKGRKWNMTMKERVEMWKASKYVTENDKKEKRMMPHQLLEL